MNKLEVITDLAILLAKWWLVERLLIPIMIKYYNGLVINRFCDDGPAKAGRHTGVGFKQVLTA